MSNLAGAGSVALVATPAEYRESFAEVGEF
jgi:hypothetical protein